MTLLVDDVPAAIEQGDLLFTHFGVSGPKVLIVSGAVSPALAEGKKVALSLNFKPPQSVDEYDKVLQNELKSSANKTVRAYWGDVFPESFALVFESRCGIPAGIKCGDVSRDMRRKIAAMVTDFRIPITKTRPIEEATITRGGVCLDEINPQSMESRLVNHLFWCGEVIDLDGSTGGYNLQEAFSTGYLAGESAAGVKKSA